MLIENGGVPIGIIVPRYNLMRVEIEVRVKILESLAETIFVTTDLTIDTMPVKTMWNLGS